MINKLFVCFILVLSFRITVAQTVLLDVDRRFEMRQTNFGPNQKKFTHATFKFGALASKDFEGARIIYGASVNFGLGLRKKIKISRVLSLGYDTELSYTDYKLSQKTEKALPDSIIHNKSERLDYFDLGLGFFSRINFDPGRGNYLGDFLDLGIMGLWDPSVKHISKDELPDGTQSKTIVKNLPYVNKTNAKLFVRLGTNHFAIFASYRITKLFKESYNYPDLPRLVLGIEASPF